MSIRIFKNSKFSTILKCVALSYIITLLSIIIFAFIVYKTYMSDESIQLGVIIIYCISSFIGGFAIGKKLKKNKFIWGLLNGFSYFVILLIISIITGGELATNSSMIAKALSSSLISGMLGGMIS